MILVKRSTSDLAAGFAILQAFRDQLKTVWEPRLLRQYARQQETYRQTQKERARKSWLARLIAGKPSPPRYPLRPSLLNQYFSPIWQAWLTSMRSTPQIEIPIAGQDTPELKFGKRGERSALQWLGRQFDDRYLAVCRLLLNHKKRADIDALVMGPKGIWYFEIKSWHGQVYGEGRNKWTQITNRGEEKEHTSPIWEWQRVADEVGAVLQPVWQDPLAQIKVMQLKGGVAFVPDETQCQLHVQAGKTVPCEHLPYWEKEISRAPTLPSATTAVTMQTISALLARHQAGHPELKVNSMAVTAKRFVYKAESKLKKRLKQ